MKYQTPELFLVGAAKGFVLGNMSEGDFKDLDPDAGNATGPGISRDTPR
jgi:hypothetical protein